MLRAIAPLIACAAMMGVVACGKADPVDDKATNTAGLPDSAEAAPDATGAPPPPAAARPGAASAPAHAVPAIPAALHGRWAMVPADCTSTRGDAKGLIVITPTEVRFYESRAVPAPGVNTSADSISGDFNFTGEGQTWTKYQALQRDRQGLVRTESNPTASFTYAKCT